MASPKCSDWLYAFQDGDEWFLMRGQGLQKVLDSLQDPANQYPSTVLFLGRAAKEAARKAMFPHAGSKRLRGLARINVDDSTLNHDGPLLVADLDIHKAYSGYRPPRSPCGELRHRVEWPSEPSGPSSERTQRNIVDTTVSKLLLLFVDVVCLFLDDFVTREAGLRLFQQWVEERQLARPWSPRVIFVTSRERQTTFPTFGEAQPVVAALKRRKLSHAFDYSGLRNIILENVEVARNNRKTSRMLFSAVHLRTLFEAGLQHTAKCLVPGFDFIQATRHFNKIDGCFTQHLRGFLRLCAATRTGKETTIDVMASAILLDSLPPGMHRGLIVLMFLLRRSIRDCTKIFNKLARRVFVRPNWFRSPFFAKLFEVFSTLLADSLYGAREMEACVKTAYGAGKLMFGNPGSSVGVSGLKIAVTAMAVSDSRLCIFSNYNGIGLRRGKSSKLAYCRYRANNRRLQALQALGNGGRSPHPARATSAAPSYFPAKFIRGLGFVQDGGAGKHNNPIDPAEWESKAIWNTGPDLALSIGTGYTRVPGSPTITAPRPRLRFRDRFFPRLFRLFGAVLDAQSNWEDHLNRVRADQRHKYFRMNIDLQQDCSLDDVDKIPEMERLAKTFLQGYDFSSITDALFAAAFFFELHQRPVAHKNYSVCLGSIRCRSPDSNALVARILEEYPAASFTTDDGTHLGPINDHSVCSRCGGYSKSISFAVYHPDQTMSIALRFSGSNKHMISGFPQVMSHFVREQLLDAEFGRPDHDVLGTYTLRKGDA
ncbi:FabD/lysophospholipase-like protein [Bimuria novae-zelandiae CBS 107.79]|uniref:FabD/lysophospholipase-like protein n=1 Tax=Bimuria novae-zelandiae CBS 107.79 TaxID=1447943 RepID=A0A6A5UTG2_9PLEO|nr:FabD/lysophospholipase-like protein [Bimuria novae-zelandiae CBS 107.79]